MLGRVGDIVLVPGHKYPKMGGDHLYGRSDSFFFVKSVV